MVNRFDEYLENEKRKKNVVVFNMPEPDGATSNQQMEQDKYAFTQLVKEHLHINPRVESCWRVGRRSDNRHRLLVVTLGSEGEKWEILRQAPLLKDAGLSPRVYINPDLSAREREKAKQLREELASRKASGETNLIIRRGKIVNRYDPASTQQSYGQNHAETSTQRNNLPHGVGKDMKQAQNTEKKKDGECDQEGDQHPANEAVRSETHQQDRIFTRQDSEAADQSKKTERQAGQSHPPINCNTQNA